MLHAFPDSEDTHPDVEGYRVEQGQGMFWGSGRPRDREGMSEVWNRMSFALFVRFRARQAGLLVVGLARRGGACVKELLCHEEGGG